MEAKVHLPDHLAAHAEVEAERLGLSLDDLILVAVHDFTEAPSDRRTRLLGKIAAFVGRRYSLQEFPEDVVLQVLRHIRADDHLRMLYDAEIRDFYGNIDSHARASLIHAIGATVASRLQGEVIGQLELDPEDPATDLADACVLLRPMR